MSYKIKVLLPKKYVFTWLFLSNGAMRARSTKVVRSLTTAEPFSLKTKNFLQDLE